MNIIYSEYIQTSIQIYIQVLILQQGCQHDHMQAKRNHLSDISYHRMAKEQLW